MPEVYYHGEDGSELAKMVEEYFNNIPVCQNDAVIILTNSRVRTVEGEKSPFISIKGSIDCKNKDLIAIANHFNTIIDTTLTFGWGPMVFHQKGHGFTEKDIEEAFANTVRAADPNY